VGKSLLEFELICREKFWISNYFVGIPGRFVGGHLGLIYLFLG
jgi:hypothetical protein